MILNRLEPEHVADCFFVGLSKTAEQERHNALNAIPVYMGYNRWQPPTSFQTGYVLRFAEDLKIPGPKMRLIFSSVRLRKGNPFFWIRQGGRNLYLPYVMIYALQWQAHANAQFGRAHDA